ncbi:hypothetical protein TRFO_32417 [Tritrichomonas foetus]|uniref:Myb-like DNA-binding domain containing protein n=1 Tax=Tritrichomonas foetus TaxID=1144522 RepID=A0A1J4JNZ2_9EUKA|nr:hypothetical protein TRFO_32417 [Tritrichomonas foetus]|eukprot:OHT00849.1 hypothetical protein TRFO_32417 [Tritrichomonas foetus]
MIAAVSMKTTPFIGASFKSNQFQRSYSIPQATAFHSQSFTRNPTQTLPNVSNLTNAGSLNRMNSISKTNNSMSPNYNPVNDVSPFPSFNRNNTSISNCSKGRQFSVKIKFTPEEDQKLLQLVQEHGSKDWIKISQLIGTRNPRQCRERFKNYINPELRKDNWTKEEDDLLLQKYSVFGGKWNKISKYFVNRSDNHLRNRWMMLARHQAKGGDLCQYESSSVESPVASSSPVGQSITFNSISQSFTERNFAQSGNQIQSGKSDPNPAACDVNAQEKRIQEQAVVVQQEKGLSSGVEELSPAASWLDGGAFDLLGVMGQAYDIFGYDQSDAWTIF